MLWYKSWLETRSRFLIGLVLLMFSAVGVVMFYPRLLTLLPQVNRVDVGGELGRRIKEGAELVHTYRGYVWSQWLRQSMSNMLTLFAVLLGAGGLLSQASRGGAMFTLSLPVSRNRVVGIRAATGLAELLVLAVVPVLLFPLLSPAVGETYGIGDALVHGACLFIAGGVVFSLTFLLSTVFSDLWRPVLIASGAAAVLGLCDPFFPALSRYGLFGIMSGEIYFRGGGLPWLGLLASAAASAAMLYAASRNIARQDF
jgi:ABC-type transport system involved in multi-copper enzyme maturation permease subunit